MSDTYRGNHEAYANVFTIYCALVNFEQIECEHPLREEDRDFYVRLLVAMQQKNEEKKKKKGRTEERRYRKENERFGQKYPINASV